MPAIGSKVHSACAAGIDAPRDAGFDGPMDTEQLDDFGGVGMLTCPNCLTCMSIQGTDDAPYLLCRDCGLVRMTE